MSQRYFERIGLTADSEPVIADIADAFGLGKVEDSRVLEAGYEDCNIRVDTTRGDFVIKAFANTRDRKQIDRYVDIMRAVIAGGVHHPTLHKTSEGELLVHPSGVSCVVMDFIEGDTYFDTKTVPTDEELDLIAAEVVKINSLDIRPTFLFDSWAIPHIEKMYKLTGEFLDDEGNALVQKVMSRYKAIDISKLTQAFVHGDIISTNTLKDNDRKIWILDFSVANVYPKVQELAVICSSLLSSREESSPLTERVEKVQATYRRAGGTLSEYESQALFDYALAGLAMEFMGGHKAKFIDGENQEETQHWQDLGRNGLQQALKETSD